MKYCYVLNILDKIFVMFFTSLNDFTLNREGRMPTVATLYIE